MFKHVYPAWHKPVQKAFFVVAVILCIALPVAYGTKRKPRPFKAQVMGAVFGAFFGVWLLFTLFVRFCVSSPRVESSLPIYTPSPIPVPVVLHSPKRSDAQPTSPAIRLQSSSATSPNPNGGTVRQTRARFADADSNQDSSDDHDGHHTNGRAANNVTFQARPRGYTAGSTNSESGGPAYPTFAAYRQAQHGNFEAFTQRIKRAFAISQQEEELQRIQQQREQEEAAAAAANAATAGSPASNGSSPGIHMQSLVAGTASGINNTSNRSLSLSGGSPQQQTQSPRSRSASAASIIGDFAERIKNGTLFSRSQVSILPQRSATDPQAQQPQQAQSRSGLSISGAGLGDINQGNAGNTGPFATTTIMTTTTAPAPAIEMMLAGESDEERSPAQQQPPRRSSSGYQEQSSEMETDDRAPILLDDVTPFCAVTVVDEEKVHSENEKESRKPRRHDSEDTVVVTADGIRRPSVNSGRQAQRIPTVEDR
ncbi:hypothetical protein BGZ83_002096 [Gryganskiella cystojenkinii]|nr:hypothetical protein BGZ83_002096 [Gryganskiella cystojenkinii]